MMTRVLLLLALATVAACSDDPDPTPDAAVVDGGSADAGSEPECYQNPTSHSEIINGCTSSQHVDKTPVLPLLNADGTLPPLP